MYKPMWWSACTMFMNFFINPLKIGLWNLFSSPLPTRGLISLSEISYFILEGYLVIKHRMQYQFEWDFNLHTWEIFGNETPNAVPVELWIRTTYYEFWPIHKYKKSVCGEHPSGLPGDSLSEEQSPTVHAGLTAPKIDVILENTHLIDSSLTSTNIDVWWIG